MEGLELWHHLFEEEDLEPYDLEDHEEVTSYNEDLSYNSGWYNYYEITFRLRGKKYSIEKKSHTSDNVCDTEWLMDTFQEVIYTNDLDKAVDNIIDKIEEEYYDSWDEVVRDLEKLKKDFNHLIEVENG